MSWIVRHILWLHLLALVMVLGWVHGGARADLLGNCVPWLTVIILEWLLVFPQAKSTESLVEARWRVWRALARDPLVYVALLLLITLVIPLFNVAPTPFFDKVAQQWVNPKPPMPFLPFCINPEQHDGLLLWFPPALVAALAVKHGLLKKGKRMLLEAICWNGAALAMLGFLQLWSGTHKLLWLTPLDSYFFSSFGYPNFAGAYFTLLVAISAGLWFYSAIEKHGLTTFSVSGQDVDTPFFITHRMLLPVALTLIAAFATLSRAAILLGSIISIVMIIYMLAFVWNRVLVGTRMTISAILAALLFLIAISLLAFKLESLKREIRNITPSEIMNRVTGQSYYHVRVAKAIFLDYPVYGVGGWGYPLYLQQYMTPEDKRNMQIVGGVNVHNDSYQILAEQGVVGYGLLLSAIMLLTVPLLLQVWRLRRFYKSTAATDEQHRLAGWLKSIPAPMVGVWVGTTATVCHSLGDLPFRTPAVLVVWVLAFACVPGWLPVFGKDSA